MPDPARNPADYAARIAEVVEVEGVAVVIPIAEPALLAVLGGRDTIRASVPFVDACAFQAVSDKQRLLEVAQEVGIRVPRQVDIERPGDVDACDLRPPYVLKPHRSVCSRPDGTRVKLGVSWAHTTDELSEALAAYPAAAYPILIQEAVTGPGIGVFVLLDDQGLVASFAHRRVREKPPSGGVSVLRQSEPMNPSLLDSSVELLRRYGWRGVAMVEYKLDELTGEPVLMEINGRFWGSLQLAIDAGVDFPNLLVGRTECSTSPGQYAFVRSRWFWGDVDHVIGVWRDRRSSGRDKLQALLGWLRAFGPGYREEVFRWSDPRPFVHETIAWVDEVLR